VADEAAIVELLGQPKGCPIRYTVANTGAIPKGSIMQISGDRTITKADTDGQFFAGIAVADKVTNDGSVTLGVWTKGIFDLRTEVGSPAIVEGERVKISGANLIVLADDDSIANAQEVVGVALQPASSATPTTIAVAIGIY